MSRFYDDDFGSTPTIFDIVRSLARPVSEFADHIDSTFKDDEAEAGDSFRADLCDLGDHYELKAELPGVRKEDIEMSFNDGVLSVKAKHNTDRERSHMTETALLRNLTYIKNYKNSVI